LPFSGGSQCGLHAGCAAGLFATLAIYRIVITKAQILAVTTLHNDDVDFLIHIVT